MGFLERLRELYKLLLLLEEEEEEEGKSTVEYQKLKLILESVLETKENIEEISNKDVQIFYDKHKKRLKIVRYYVVPAFKEKELNYYYHDEALSKAINAVKLFLKKANGNDSHDTKTLVKEIIQDLAEFLDLQKKMEKIERAKFSNDLSEDEVKKRMRALAYQENQKQLSALSKKVFKESDANLLDNPNVIEQNKEVLNSKKVDKINKLIEAEIKKALKKGENLNLIEAQNKIAEKLQDKSWYRGGKTKKDGTATGTAQAINWKRETLIVWKLYDELPKSNLFESGDRSKMGINKNYTLKLDKKGIYEKSSLQGTLTINFDDLGIPDKLTVFVEIEGTVIPFIKNYGEIFDDSDNTWKKDFDLKKITNYDITIRIEHPKGALNFNNTDYELEIKMNGVGKLKTPIMNHKIISLNVKK